MLCCIAFRKNFNPRSVRDGATCIVPTRFTGRGYFNPRSVRDGATKLIAPELDKTSISIHAPCETERRELAEHFEHRRAISIHAPCETERHGWIFTTIFLRQFQSTLRARRSDLLQSCPLSSASHFNPRSVRDGATYGSEILPENV